jgi:hypothetical protein
VAVSFSACLLHTRAVCRFKSLLQCVSDSRDATFSVHTANMKFRRNLWISFEVKCVYPRRIPCVGNMKCIHNIVWKLLANGRLWEILGDWIGLDNGRFSREHEDIFCFLVCLNTAS